MPQIFIKNSESQWVMVFMFNLVDIMAVIINRNQVPEATCISGFARF